MNIVPVILAGGIGERFWPASRSSNPKQLLSLVSSDPMIVDTIRRVAPLAPAGVKPLIVTSEKIADIIEKEIGDLWDFDMIKEPFGRNTAPAVAAAAAFCSSHYGQDSVMAVVSADHAISPAEEFIATARYGADIASEMDTLVVYGIQPDRPETGYGYLKIDSLFRDEGAGKKAYTLDSFVEKPDARTAQSYLEDGGYLWNSGMFIWRSSVILAEFQRSMPGLFSLAEQLQQENFTTAAIRDFYERSPKESIDFGIMEHAASLHAVAGDFDWDDVGSWSSLERVKGCDGDKNTLDGEGIYISESSNTIVSNRTEGSSVAVIGAEDMVVVTVDDAVLVIAREKLPEIKKHIAELKARNFPPELF
ncbi:MAG: mannose-1-phosphate guanylyltransferase [Fibrobacterota bacterium]